MPTVTSKNREEFNAAEMAKKEIPKGSHASAQLPEVQGAKLESKNKERLFHHGMQMANEMRRSHYLKDKGWKDTGSKFYDKELNTPPKNPHQWAHHVQSLEHPELGEKHIVLSQDPKGFSVSSYAKSKD